jgi:hypothetical protein
MAAWVCLSGLTASPASREQEQGDTYGGGSDEEAKATSWAPLAPRWLSTVA